MMRKPRAEGPDQARDTAPDAASGRAPDGARDRAPDGAGDTAPDGARDRAPDGALALAPSPSPRAPVAAPPADRSPAAAARQRVAEATRCNILDVAMREFAAHGLAGARVDVIAEQTATSKRMIYYHFRSKEGLYLAVLERAYDRLRGLEEQLDLTAMPPDQALRALIGVTFDHDLGHPDFVRLVGHENAQEARILLQSNVLSRSNQSVLRILAEILARGLADGSFRRPIEPLDLHQMISALCLFPVANRFSFQALFGRDMTAPAQAARHRVLATEIILAYLKGADLPPLPSSPPAP